MPPNTPNFKPGQGRIATDLYDFKKHTDGYDFNHDASQIEINDPGSVFGNASNVEDALVNLSMAATAEARQTFLTLGDGYDTWHNANGTTNFDNSVPSLDLLLNPIFNAIINNTSLPIAYQRLKNGGVIVLKSGTYIVKQTINVPAGITIMGEGYGTKIINGTNLDFSYYPPRRKTVQTSAPVFLVKRDLNRDSTSDKQNNNTLYTLPFMFQKVTKFINLLIADNFVQEPVLGDTYWNLPQSIYGYSGPTIKQENCSNLELHGVYLVGKSLYGNIFPDPQIITSYYAVLLDTTVSNSNYPQSILKINNCFIDNYAQPVKFNGPNAGNDVLEISNSKIRALGYALGDQYGPTNNAIFNIDNNTINISNNIINNKGSAYLFVYYNSRNDGPNLAPSLGIISSNIIDGIQVNNLFNPIGYGGTNTAQNNRISMFGNFGFTGFTLTNVPLIRNNVKSVSGTYNVVSSDSILLAAGNTTINLPSVGTIGQELIIKAPSTASTNPVTISATMTTIDGSVTSLVINQNNASVTLLASESYGWLII